MAFVKSAFLFLNKVYNNKKLLLVFIFLISLFASAIFLFFLGNLGPAEHAIPGNDYLSFYEPVANNILQGKGVLLEGESGFRYPPGYPIILVPIFGLAQLLGIGKLGLIVIFNIIVTAGATCLLFLIAEMILSRRIALIASFLWLSYPLNLWFLKNPNTELPFIFLFYTGVWLFLSALKKKNFGLIFLSGAILGLNSLIRPIGLLLPFLLALLIFFFLKESPKKLCFLLALTLLAGSFLAILPWEVYAFSAIGQVIPLSNSGPTAIVDGFTFAVRSGAGGDQARVSEDVLSLMVRTKSGDLDTGSKIFDFIAEELVNRPIPFLKLVGWKLTRSWYATSQMWWEGKMLMLQLIYLIPGLFGIIYGFKKYKDKAYSILFILGIIIYFWLMTFAALSIARYMIPAMGLMMIFSSIAVSLLIDKLSKRVWKKMSR
ncbi:MAG: glycosyltransferase family 39 protein [bacterium]|nr:glycosyltransferase family 39 protein [bacterium]